MPFTRTGAYADVEPMMISRGDRSHIYDSSGERYLDGLSGLFCVNVGHGRQELADAAGAQGSELGFFPVWGFVHPRAVELAEKVAALAPGDLNRTFFTSGGSDAVESALKLSRAYHRATGNGRKYKVIARKGAYHGVSFGAMSVSGVTAMRVPFEPLMPGGCHVENTNRYRAPEGADPLLAAEQIEERILFEGPETVAAVILEPVQNAGGCLTPPEGYFARVREICDAHDVLLISDEVICAWGRLGEYFGCQRYDYEPDMIATAKGLTSGYVPMGALIASDRLAEPFVADDESMFAHGFTFSAHPVAAAVALANLQVLEREGLCEHVREHEGELKATLERLYDLPVVGDIRGAGYFYAIELVRDQAQKTRFSADDVRTLVRSVLPEEMTARGLLTRADDRGGEPVVLLCPPLVAGEEEFDEIEQALRGTFEAVMKRFGSTGGD